MRETGFGCRKKRCWTEREESEEVVRGQLGRARVRKTRSGGKTDMFGSKNIGWGAVATVSRGPTQAAREGGTGKGSENQVTGVKIIKGVENKGWG